MFHPDSSPAIGSRERGNSLNDDESCKNEGESRGGMGMEGSRFLTTRQNLSRRKINTTSHEAENASEKSSTKVERPTHKSISSTNRNEYMESAPRLSVP